MPIECAKGVNSAVDVGPLGDPILLETCEKRRDQGHDRGRRKPICHVDDDRQSPFECRSSVADRALTQVDATCFGHAVRERGSNRAIVVPKSVQDGAAALRFRKGPHVFDLIEVVSCGHHVYRILRSLADNCVQEVENGRVDDLNTVCAERLDEGARYLS